MKEQSNNERRLELSVKLNEMGSSLTEEGNDRNDVSIAQSGTILWLISNLILEKNDMGEFFKLCNMFSSQKTIENIMDTDPDLLKQIYGVDARKFNDKLKKNIKPKGRNNQS